MRCLPIHEQYSNPVTNPHVTVVIPVYNEEHCIKDCILSLLNQDLKPVEIIVVDDGSKDNSVDLCRTLGIKVMQQNHKGPGAARNLGATIARGNILVFIDADMLFASDYISKLVAPIIKGEAIATCHWNERVANWENPWARCQTWFMGLPDKRRHRLETPEHEMVYRAVRKDFFLESGGYAENEGRSDDSSIARRTGVVAKIVPDAICYHKNFETPKELYTDAIWHGRNIVAKNISAFRSIGVLLFYKNPILEISKGFFLSITKREPIMMIYSILYIYGFVLGVLRAMASGRYLK